MLEWHKLAQLVGSVTLKQDMKNRFIANLFGDRNIVTNTMTAYIPAGSQEGIVDPVSEAAGVTNKALIPLNGKPLITYTLDALDQSEMIDNVIVVGLDEKTLNYKISKPIEFFPSEGTGFDTVMNLVKYLQSKDNPPTHLVGLSSDIPFITGKILDRNIKEINPFDNPKDLFYPLTTKDVMLKQFPDANKRYRKFKEGTFATGDLFIFRPNALLKPETADAIEKIMLNRKYILKILFKFQKLAPLKYILGRMSIEKDIKPFMKEYIFIDMEVFVSEDAEICMDLDYAEDLPNFERLIKEKGL